MKKILLIIFVMLTIGMNSQVGIGTDTPNLQSVIDMSTITEKGFLGPQVDLVDPSLPDPLISIEEGVTVYNKTFKEIPGSINLEVGYYTWKSGRWDPLSAATTSRVVDIEGINVAVLGYYPDQDMNSAKKTINLGTVKGVQTKCAQYTKGVYEHGDNHGYCVYELDRGVTWIESFNIAKSLGGYLVSMTSLDEWNFVKDSFLSPVSSVANKPKYNNNIWIGYNKVAYPGNPSEFTWITGEESLISWGSTINISNTIATLVQHNFNVGEPNNYGGVEGCSHISGTRSADTTFNTRPWNDNSCTKTTEQGGDFNFIIVEFQS